MIIDDDFLRDVIARVESTAKGLTTSPNAPKYHHLVPQSYIRRWADERGIVCSTRISDGKRRCAGPKKVGGEDHFYRLEADDIDIDETPPLLVEVLLGELETTAKGRIDDLVAYAPGTMRNRDMLAPMSAYISAQMTRGNAFRDEQRALIEFTESQEDPIEHSKNAVRAFLFAKGQRADEATIERLAAESRAVEPVSADSKAQEIELMVKNWKYVMAEIVTRDWAIYRTASALVTTDDPVVRIAGPGADRAIKPGNNHAPVWIFPLDRFRLLAFFRSDIRPRHPFVLDEAETLEINRELIAGAYDLTFELPEDHITEVIRPGIPPRPHPELATSIVDLSRRPTRWKNVANPPPPPVSRWYEAMSRR